MGAAHCLTCKCVSVVYCWQGMQADQQHYFVCLCCLSVDCSICMQDVREKLVTERERMLGQLLAIPFLHVFPSSSNFLLCKVTQGYDAKQVKLGLSKQGIMVRHYAQPHLSGYIRISVGKPEQTDKLMRALKRL